MELTNREFTHLKQMYYRMLDVLPADNINMIEFKRIVNKGNIKSVPKPPPPPKGRTIKQPGLFSWITKDRVEFMSKNKDGYTFLNKDSFSNIDSCIDELYKR